MAKKVFLRHNSAATLSGSYNGVKYFFPPNTDTEVFDKANAEAIISDFNTASPQYKMELVERDVADDEVVVEPVIEG